MAKRVKPPKNHYFVKSGKGRMGDQVYYKKSSIRWGIKEFENWFPCNWAGWDIKLTMNNYSCLVARPRKRIKKEK